MTPWKNSLYFGDNLNILRDHIADKSVDLVYLDPPFNSNANYNVLFKESSGKGSSAQITAFDDTWHWSKEVELSFMATVQNGGRLSDLLQAFLSFLGRNDTMAYLVMMAPRLQELHRVLKPTGSIYLHCDPTASHYLKLMLDSIFGIENFRNEIVWKRKAGRGETNNAAIRFGVSHDVIFFYARSEETRFLRQYRPNNPKYIEEKFTNVDPDGRKYHLDNLTSPSDRPNLKYEYKGYAPPEKGWAVSLERMKEMDAAGRLYFPNEQSKRIRRKRYLDELQGETVDTLWDDIPPINSQAQERMGYPTQKPEALLERILKASSSEGDVVLDPFCGCGTSIAVAEKLNRHWIGVDITHLAITLIRHRLKDGHGADLKPYEVIGDPKDTASAKALAEMSTDNGRYQFEWWALGLVDARPAQDKRKGADKGVDGHIYFFDDTSGKAKKAVVQVKSGHVNRGMIATLNSDRQREKAEIGIFVTLEPTTKPMREEALTAGFYEPEYFPGMKVPRIQIFSIDELLGGARPQLPVASHLQMATFKKAGKVEKPVHQKQTKMFD